MSAAIARFAHITPEPWKNGLGVTTQLAIHPAHASAETFEWRISIAKVERSTRFSAFPGIERNLAVLQGAMTLSCANASAVTLTVVSAPVRFPGDVECEADVELGPALDLNVMTRRSRWRASLHRMRLRGDAMTLNAHRMVCSLEEHVRIQLDGEVVSLNRYDLVRVTASTELSVVSPSGCDAYVVELEELQRP